MSGESEERLKAWQEAALTPGMRQSQLKPSFSLQTSLFPPARTHLSGRETSRDHWALSGVAQQVSGHTGSSRFPGAPSLLSGLVITLCQQPPTPFPVTCTCFPALLNLSIHRLCVPRDPLSYLLGGCWSQLQHTKLINSSSSPLWKDHQLPRAGAQNL